MGSAILRDDQDIAVYTRDDFLMRRDTNTVAVKLDAAEAVRVIAKLADSLALGGPVWLVVESDRIYAKDMD